jgi:hypothetical protein
MKDLNISRIILFAVVIFAANVLIGALIPSFEEFEEPDAHTFWLVTEYLVQVAIGTAIFVRLAWVQARLLYVHIACVLALNLLLGYAAMFALVGHILTSPLMVVVLDYSVFAVSIVVGTEIGRRLRIATEKKRSPDQEIRAT